MTEAVKRKIADAVMYAALKVGERWTVWIIVECRVKCFSCKTNLDIMDEAVNTSETLNSAVTESLSSS